MRKQVFAVCAFFCVFPIFSSAQDPAAQAAQHAFTAYLAQDTLLAPLN